MAWLRIDDAFPQHPKLAGWTASQKWALVELFSYCARHKTEGHVPSDLSLLPRAVTAKVLALAEDSGLLDRDEYDGLVVHDWRIYNPSDVTAAERMKRLRERNAERNGAVTASVTSRARLPSRPQERITDQHEQTQTRKQLVSSELDLLRADLLRLGANSSQRETFETNVGRARSAIAKALGANASNPISYAIKIFGSTDWQPSDQRKRQPVNVSVDVECPTCGGDRFVVHRTRLPEQTGWMREHGITPSSNPIEEFKPCPACNADVNADFWRADGTRFVVAK